MAISDLTRVYRWEIKVQKTDGCWLWTGTKNRAGYGSFMWEPGFKTTAHKAGYMLFVGPVPDGWEIDHAVCQNPSCVRPDHLEAVTLSENRRRRRVATGDRTRNGKKTHCYQGHPLSGENLRVGKDDSRLCRECIREYRRQYRAKARLKQAAPVVT